MNIQTAGEEVYKILKQFNTEDQKEILRDCGLSFIVDAHRLIPSDKDFKIKLDTAIDIIKGEYGNKIKYASWSGIKETILKAQKSTTKPLKKINIKVKDKGLRDLLKLKDKLAEKASGHNKNLIQ